MKTILLSAIALTLLAGLGCGSPGLGESCTQGGPVCRNSEGKGLICAYFGNVTRCTSGCATETLTDISPNPADCASGCSCVQIGADNQYGHTFVCHADGGDPC